MPKQTIAQKSVYWMKVISLGLILGLGIQFAEAWTSPSSLVLPPGGNVSGPITNGIVAQYKTGMLGVNSTTAPVNALEVGGGGNAVIGGSISIGGNLYTAGSSVSSSFGALTLQGSKNGWSGINFRDINGSNAGTLMMRSDYSGFFNAADNNWRWVVDNTGTSYQLGSMILGGKATSLSTAAADPGNTMVTKDYVDSKVVGGGVPSGTFCGGRLIDEFGNVNPDSIILCNNNARWEMMGGICPTGYELKKIYTSSVGGMDGGGFQTCVKL